MNGHSTEFGGSGRVDITRCDICLHALTGRCPSGKCERVTGTCLVTGKTVAESHFPRSAPGATS